jgi:type IV secretory pathway VirB4 component
MGPLRALLGPEHNGRHVPFIVEWMLMLASMHGYAPTSDDKIDLDQAVRSVAEQGADHPEKLRISSVVVSLPASSRLASELLPWAAEHVYGAYFDNEEDNLDVNGLVGIETARSSKTRRWLRPTCTTSSTASSRSCGPEGAKRHGQPHVHLRA